MVFEFRELDRWGFCTYGYALRIHVFVMEIAQS